MYRGLVCCAPVSRQCSMLRSRKRAAAGYGSSPLRLARSAHYGGITQSPGAAALGGWHP